MGCLPTRILKLMYDSFILHLISYGITVWGFNMNRIIKLQKKSVRIICKTKYNAHTDPLCKKIQILKAQDMFQLNNLKIYHKHINNQVPNYISNLFQRREHEYY